MKWLERLFDRAQARLAKPGMLSRIKPLVDATEKFYFWSADRAHHAPHVRDPLDVKRYMMTVIFALAPVVLAGWYFFGLRTLLVIGVSYAAGGAFEVLFACVRKEEINEGFLVTGLLFPLILPPAIPLWMVAVGVAFGVVVGKELFGGTGRNLFNPALVGRCFLALAYPEAMSHSGWIKPILAWPGRLFEYVGAHTPDALTGATPLGVAKTGSFGSSWDLFLGNVSGSIGETSALLVIAGGLFLLITRVGNYRSTAGMLGSFFALGGLMNLLGVSNFGPVGPHMLAGGLLFGAFFMATDPVTAPSTNQAKWVYGILIGAVALLIRNLTGYVEGVMFAILLGNIFAPLLDEVAIRRRLGRLKREA